MPTALMVAEKPSICNAIAEALSGGRHESRGRTPPVHEFNYPFMGGPCRMIVTSVVGHIFSVDFPKEYQNWEATDPASLFQAPVLRSPEKRGIVKHLQNEASGVDYLILWLDCDREGENICFEVIDCVKSKMARPDSEYGSCVGGQQIFRAFFSAIGPSDIKKAMGELGEPNENESLSVDARQELDLKVRRWLMLFTYTAMHC
jgi:DNA topoisomerase-3